MQQSKVHVKRYILRLTGPARRLAFSELISGLHTALTTTRPSDARTHEAKAKTHETEAKNHEAKAKTH